MSKVLVLFAHPALHRSRVNRVLLAAARTVDGVRTFDLYSAYPDFHIDVAEQQALLVEHDTVVFQHPFFWYSSPAILKEWQDLVLEFGFAYGPEGHALAGKRWMSAITTGGDQEAYGPEGRNRYTIAEFLRPFEQTAGLCGMAWLEPHVVQGSHRLTDDAIAAAAEGYRARLAALVAEPAAAAGGGR